MVPPPYMEHVSYGPPHVHMVLPHVQSDGPPLPNMEQVLYGSPHVCMVPHMYNMIFFRPASKESTAYPNDLTKHTLY